MPNFAFIADVTVSKRKVDRVIRNYKHFDNAAYREDLAGIEIPEATLESGNIDTIYNYYHEQILSVMNKHAPFRMLSRKEVRMKRKPWITKGILKAIKEKEYFYKKYKQTKMEFWYTRCKVYTKMIKKITFLSKKSYYHKYFSQNSANAKKIWTGINEILKNQKSDCSGIFINHNGSIITDSKAVANAFNIFFSNVAEELLTKIENPTNKYQDYLKNPNEHSFFLNEVDEGEVCKILSQLDITKAGDIYGINNKLLKLGSLEIAPNLTKIVNTSFKLGQFPDKLKVAMIIPIFKNGIKTLVGNYRPISLVPVIGKVLEMLCTHNLLASSKDSVLW